jgi:hypothetical protein
MRTKARHYYPPIKKCRGSTLTGVALGMSRSGSLVLHGQTTWPLAGPKQVQCHKKYICQYNAVFVIGPYNNSKFKKYQITIENAMLIHK